MRKREVVKKWEQHFQPSLSDSCRAEPGKKDKCEDRKRATAGGAACQPRLVSPWLAGQALGTQWGRTREGVNR